MPWVLKATFRNWANVRGKASFGKAKSTSGNTVFGTKADEFGNITCILPKSFFNPHHKYESMQAVEVDMEDMQKKHERILGRGMK